jgi:hypothetical protein
MGIRAKVERSWTELKRGTPGKRFQQRYRRKNPGGGRSGRKVAIVLLGSAAVLGGLFLLVVPGPGLPLIAIGAGLLAEASLVGARALDWLELRVRALIGWAREHWTRAGTPARAGIGLTGLLFVGAAGFAAWQIVFGR